MFVNFYAGSGLDRVSHVRRDEAWLLEQLQAPGTRVVPVWRSQSLMVMGDSPAAVYLNGESAAAFAAQGALVVFLGLLDDVAHFAVDLSHHDRPLESDSLRGRGEFVDLRTTGALLDRANGSLLAYARGLMYWHARHRFCGACGHPTRVGEAGHTRVCTNAGCGIPHFPRTDPAVIMLVTDGDRCLMGRQSAFPPGMYSTLAGFVEPGESLEEAVSREVFEETAIRTTDVRYHSSQPWPFPGSIMLGFHARALDTAITVNRSELEDARWFTRAELRASPENETFRMPRKVSIARQLVDHWINEE